MTSDEIAVLTLEHLRRFDQKLSRVMEMTEDLRDRVSSLEIQVSGAGREMAGLRGDFARLEHRKRITWIMRLIFHENMPAFAHDFRRLNSALPQIPPSMPVRLDEIIKRR